jgi:hypothetical protein
VGEERGERGKGRGRGEEGERKLHSIDIGASQHFLTLITTHLHYCTSK